MIWTIVGTTADQPLVPSTNNFPAGTKRHLLNPLKRLELTLSLRDSQCHRHPITMKPILGARKTPSPTTSKKVWCPVKQLLKKLQWTTIQVFPSDICPASNPIWDDILILPLKDTIITCRTRTPESQYEMSWQFGPFMFHYKVGYQVDNQWDIWDCMKTNEATSGTYALSYTGTWIKYEELGALSEASITYTGARGLISGTNGDAERMSRTHTGAWIETHSSRFRQSFTLIAPVTWVH